MAKNLVQISIAGTLYDIRDQRLATKLDYIQASMNLALEHKQDISTAVVTNEASVNWIGRLSSGSTNSVVRNKDDYADIITGTQDAYVHSLWFSMGPISYEQKDKENKELEQLRAWSKSFGVEFQNLSKKPRIIGLDSKDQKAEVDIYGKSLHTEYIDSPLGISYIKSDRVKTLNHDIISLPQSIQEIDRTQWLYYGRRDNESGAKPLPEGNNVIGLESAITNIALQDFFQKEGGDYYRVLSEERIANKQVNKSQRAQNAYKIITLDENGIIPNIFFNKLKLDSQMDIGDVSLISANKQFIIKNDNAKEDNFIIAFQPSATDDNTTKLTQNTINTKDITANNITVSDKAKIKTLEVTENASILGDIKVGSTSVTGNITAKNISASGDITANNVTIANKTKTSTLEVTDSTTIANSLTANSADIAGNFTAKNVTISNTLETEKLNVNGNAYITGIITTDAISITKGLEAENATISDKTETKTLEVDESAIISDNVTVGGDASIGNQLVVGGGTFNTSSTDSNVSINRTKVRASNVLATKCLTIPVFSNEAAATAAASAAPAGTAAIWVATY